MPTKRARVGRHRVAEIPGWRYDYFVTGEIPFGTNNALEAWILHGRILRACVSSGRHGLREWSELRDEILETFIEANPGQRPWAWWLLEGPFEKIEGPSEEIEGELVQRRRVGGSGSTTGDPRLSFGIADCVDMFDPPRPDALPLFESEAAYLRRHGLLTAAEKKRLKKKDFAPVVLDVDPEELAELHEFLEHHYSAASRGA